MEPLSDDIIRLILRLLNNEDWLSFRATCRRIYNAPTYYEINRRLISRLEYYYQRCHKIEKTQCDKCEGCFVCNGIGQCENKYCKQIYKDLCLKCHQNCKICGKMLCPHCTYGCHQQAFTRDRYCRDCTKVCDCCMYQFCSNCCKDICQMCELPFCTNCSSKDFENGVCRMCVLYDSNLSKRF